jgi:hypothetical protein
MNLLRPATEAILWWEALGTTGIRGPKSPTTLGWISMANESESLD